MLPTSLLDLLRCPSSLESLQVLEADGRSLLQSASGKAQYPLLNGIPWLLPNPDNSLIDWGQKLQHFAQVLAEEIQLLEADLPRTEGATHQRLQALYEGKQHFLKRVGELMMPVIATPVVQKRLFDALRDRAPNTQNLLSYEANVYRDWAWGDEENQLSCEIVAKHFTANVHRQKVAVLGAGAARLAFDLHEALGFAQCVATDINPLLVLIAQHLLSGNDLDFYEFPMQPRRLEDVAVMHRMRGRKAPENFHLLFADATKPAFAPHAFDAVVTPWLIDIQPLAFARFMQQLNQYVPVGGHWVNFGSLVFNQQRDMLCYSLDEVREIAKQQGFLIEDIKEHDMPYLKSPHNAGYRMERVVSWRAVKESDVACLKTPQTLPGWILDPKHPIPKAAFVEQFAFTYRIYAQLAAEVDGRTSLEKIGKKLAKQNKMPEEEGVQMVANFFLDLYTQNTMK